MTFINKTKTQSKISTKTAAWKLVPSPFQFAKNCAQPLFENETLEASGLYQICIIKLSEHRPPNIRFIGGFFEN